MHLQKVALDQTAAMDPCIHYEPYQKHLVPKTKEDEEEDERIYTNYTNFISTLPRIEDLPYAIHQYQGFWFPDFHMKGVLSARDHFKSLPTDILLASCPKSGTTWLKALIFSIAHRHSSSHPPSAPDHPLLTNNPHDLVLDIEYHLHGDDRIRELDNDFPQPRLLAAHTPYTLLPQSVIDSGCKIVYISRNPKDNFVSLWHYTNKCVPENEPPVKLEKAFEMYIKEVSTYGPYWDHVLGYWREARKEPDRVLFLKYEEMQAEPSAQLKKLALFMGYPFSEDEERDGIVEEIIRLCSFESLTSFQVNKTGVAPFGLEYSTYFRTGGVGDSENYLTEDMIKRLDEITELKFRGSGLTF